MLDRINKYKKNIWFYSIFIFIVIAANFFFFKRFILSEELIIRQGDPIDSFIPNLIFIKNKILNGDFSLLSWEPGMGVNTISAFSGSVFINLLLLPALLLSEKGIFTYFKVLPFIASIIFAVLLFKYILYLIEKDETEPSNIKGSLSNMIIAGTGSLIVSLAIIIVNNAIVYPIFYASFCLLPLLLWGLEKILREGRYRLFIFAVFLQAITSFYFLFVFSLFLVFYYAVEKAVISRSFKEFFADSAKCAGAYLLGLGMGCVIFIPQFLGVLASPRVTIDGFSRWFKIYEFAASANLLQDYFFDILGLSILPFAFIPIVFLTKSIKYVIKYSLYLLFIIIPIISPVLSWLMSGFDFPQQRWFPIIGILIAVLFAKAFYKIAHFKSGDNTLNYRKQSRFIYLVCLPAVVGLGISGLLLFNESFYKIYKASEFQIKFGLIVLLALALTVLLYFLQKYSLLTFVIVFSSLVLINTTLVTNIAVSNLVERTVFLETDYFDGKGIFDGTKEVNAKISELDKSFFRTQKTFMSESRNDSLTDGTNSYNIYNSKIDGDYVQFLFEAQNIPNDGLYWNVGNSLDRRIFLETLFGNKYYISKEDNVPQYGYTKKLESNGFYVYENSVSLPVGIFFDKYITKKEYMKLPEPLRDVTLSKAVVLDKKTNRMDKYDTTNIRYDLIPISTDQIKAEKFNLTPKNNNSFSLMLNKETDMTENPFLIISPISQSEGFYFLDYTLKRKNRNKKMNISVFVPQNGYKNSTTERALNQKAFYPNQEHTFYLGHFTDGVDKIKITMSKQNFSIYNMNLYRIDTKMYDEVISKLSANALKDVIVTGSEVKGQIEASVPGYVLFSIPFDNGWKAYVNGKRVHTEKIDIAFTGIKVAKGLHKIELRYTPPGLKIGGVISALSMGIFMFFMVFNYKNI